MKIIMVSHIVLIMLMCITGCGTIKQAVPFPDQNKLVEDQNKGRIYVIGHPFFNFVSQYGAVTVVSDNKWIGDIVGQSYLCWEREAGMVTIVGRRLKSNKLDFNIESGKVYYVLLNTIPVYPRLKDYIFPAGAEVHVKLELVDEKTGKTELLKCKPPEAMDNLQKTPSESSH